MQEFGSLPKYLSDQAAKMGNPGQTKTQADFNRTNFETILAWDWYLPVGLLALLTAFIQFPDFLYWEIDTLLIPKFANIFMSYNVHYNSLRMTLWELIF